MVWRRNIIRTFWKLKVEKHRLGAVYFSSEVTWLDSTHQGRCMKGNWEKNNIGIFFFSKFSWPKMLIGGCGGGGGVISYAQSKLFVAFKYCVFSIYIGIAFIETIQPLTSSAFRLSICVFESEFWRSDVVWFENTVWLQVSAIAGLHMTLRREG